jgi:hypothetical protein
MATPTPGPITLLEAVNIILANDGETGVSALDEDNEFSEAGKAEATLHEISRAVQTGGHGFNTDFERKFTPTVANEIELPASMLSVTPSGISESLYVVERGRKLYDLDANSYTFTQPVYLDVVNFLEWDDLPSAVRYYITVRAARVYQARNTGSPQQNSFTESDEARAEADFKKADRRMRKRGFFRNPRNTYGLRRSP